MKKQQVVAVVIMVAVVAWMIIPRSSRINGEEPLADSRRIVAIPEQAVPSEDSDVLSVRAVRIQSQTYTEQLRVRGRTQAFRMVEVKAETAGQVIGEPVPRGARVTAGDVLCEIAVDSRQADLEEAISRHEQALLEYEASLDLLERNLQSEVNVAQRKAALDAAAAAVTRAELALEKTRILAPFDGIVESRSIELGDYLTVGTTCATVLDDQPMLLVGLVPENDVGKIQVGAKVRANVLTGQTVNGEVTYLAQSADPVSRSYPIEIEVDPAHRGLRAGVTSEILVDAAETNAHLIPSSALSLDDSGEIGVKTIGADGLVEFHGVEIVGDAFGQLNPGVWVSGLSGEVTLITVGQEIVFPGQRVQVSFDWGN